MTDTRPPECIGLAAATRGQPASSTPAAHPTDASQPRDPMPTIDPSWENPNGVPISAFHFGGRRPTTMPLVFQAFNWSYGVYIGAERWFGDHGRRPAAQSGKVRRDPMAMLPFCGYHMGVTFRHWLRMQHNLSSTPRVFHVNWFSQRSRRQVSWPGYSENMRVLKWIVDPLFRAAKVPAVDETRLGYRAYASDLGRDLTFPLKQFKRTPNGRSRRQEARVMGTKNCFSPSMITSARDDL